MSQQGTGETLFNNRDSAENAIKCTKVYARPAVSPISISLVLLKTGTRVLQLIALIINCGQSRDTPPIMARSKYSKGENILCYHGPLLYEAKILKIYREKTRGQSKVTYLVHYKGWKTK